MGCEYLENKRTDRYLHNNRLNNALSYASLGLIAIAAFDVGHTFFTGQSFVGQYMHSSHPFHVYFPAALLTLLGALGEHQSRSTQKKRDSDYAEDLEKIRRGESLERTIKEFD